MQLSDPLSSEQNISAYYESLQNVKAPIWDMTFLQGTNCNGMNTLNESQVTSAGTTNMACQALPTQAPAVTMSVNQGFCINMYYSSDCTEPMRSFCNQPGGFCATPNYVNNKSPQLFNSFDVV